MSPVPRSGGPRVPGNGSPRAETAAALVPRGFVGPDGGFVPSPPPAPLTRVCGRCKRGFDPVDGGSCPDCKLRGR